VNPAANIPIYAKEKTVFGRNDCQMSDSDISKARRPVNASSFLP
jgi:hypothetical protein